MLTNLADIIENTKQIYMTDSSLDTLLDFERVLDELDLYAFSHWKMGELVTGPIYEKYWVSCTFMWPYNKMPDPRGGERLLDYGCEIKFQKSKLSYPVRVKKPEDYIPGTKYPQTTEVPIWLVEITVPKKLMTDIHQGSLDLEAEKLDMEDIESAYETGMDDEDVKQDGQPPQNGANAANPNMTGDFNVQQQQPQQQF